LRTQNNWQAYGWDLNLDLDLVSDPLYLYSFRNDLDGFYYSQSLFNRYFGRTLNEELDPLRISTFFAQKSWDYSYFRGSLKYTDDLSRNNNSDILQNMPSIYYALVSQPLFFSSASSKIANSPRLSFDAHYDYFTRKRTNNIYSEEIGHRINLSPSIFWYQELFGLIGFRADGGLDYAMYAPSGFRPAENGRRESHGAFSNSFSGHFRTELTSTFSRVYGDGSADGISTMHQITPMLSFDFVNSPDQSDLPFFDMLDRHLNRRTIRYGIRNTFVRRIPSKNQDGQITGYDYSELFRLGVYSSYEFASNLKWSENYWGRYFTSGYFDKGVGPLELEVETNINPWISARLLSSMDGRTGSFTSHDLFLKLADMRGDSLSLIYDYESPSREKGPISNADVSQMRADLTLDLTGGWKTQLSTRYDYHEQRSLETYVSLGYNDQCYGLALLYEDSDHDRRLALVVDLLGLGSFGSPSASLSSQRSN
jgi:hypothetical protein